MSLNSLSSMVIFLPSLSSVSELSLLEALPTTASTTAGSGPSTILSSAWPGFSATGEWFDDIEEEKDNRGGVRNPKSCVSHALFGVTNENTAVHTASSLVTH